MRAKTKAFLFLFNVFVLLQAESALEKAVEYRKAEQFSQAERLLKKYSVPADFAGLSSSEKVEFLRGVLELAHVKLKKEFCNENFSYYYCPRIYFYAYNRFIWERTS